MPVGQIKLKYSETKIISSDNGATEYEPGNGVFLIDIKFQKCQTIKIAVM